VESLQKTGKRFCHTFLRQISIAQQAGSIKIQPVTVTVIDSSQTVYIKLARTFQQADFFIIHHSSIMTPIGQSSYGLSRFEVQFFLFTSVISHFQVHHAR
jgi:hypothetical protein